MALAAAVSPDALIRRTNSDISGVIADLNVKVDIVLPLLCECKDAECTDALTLEIAAAVDVAAGALVDLEGIVDLSLGQDIVDVVVKIAVALDSHKATCNGQCGDLSVYAKVDLSISLLLKQLGLCVSGLLTLIVGLLAEVLAILKGLNLKLVLDVCLSI